MQEENINTNKHSLTSEQKVFELFLNRKSLSPTTIGLYILYHEKMVMLLNETETDLDQNIVDAFLDLYPNVVSRAFLKNYLEFLRRKDLDIVRKTGRKAKREVKIIPDEDLKLISLKLYEHDTRYGLILDLSLGCALRRQEVLKIKVEDIKTDFDKDTMSILIHGKGDRERTVIVPRDVAKIVATFVLYEKLTMDDYLFKSKAIEGNSISSSAWNKMFASVSYDTVGKKYHPHQLRHTQTTNWYEQGKDIVRIKQRLGHSSISTTMLYINPDNKKELDLWSKEA
jgi:integrase